MEGKSCKLCVLLFLLVVVEITAHDILLDILHPKLASWIYFLAGVLISTVIIIPSRKQNKQGSVTLNGFSKYLFPLGVIILFALFAPKIASNFVEHPLDYKVADMLPIMSIMTERFLSGANPYAIIPEIWGGMQPIYLPAMWLPFVLSEIIDFDMRWVTYALIGLGCLALYLIGNRNHQASIWTNLALVPLAILLYSIAYVDIRLLVHSEEGIVIAYYLLLAAGLYYRSFSTIVIALALCMMSRYSLAVWALMFIIYVYHYHTKSRALRLVLYSGGLAIFLLVLSRGILHIDVFASLSSDYLRDIQLAEHKWKFMPTINESLGFAKFLRYEDLPMLHNVFLMLSLAVPFGCLFVYHKMRDRINQRFYNLASLKLTLVFFYNFLILPVQYLFYTSTFLSIAILYFYIKERFDLS